MVAKPSLDEAKITPEMIDAGVDALLDAGFGLSGEECLSARSAVRKVLAAAITGTDGVHMYVRNSHFRSGHYAKNRECNAA